MKSSPTIAKITSSLEEDGYRLSVNLSNGEVFANLSVANAALVLNDSGVLYTRNDLMFAGLDNRLASAVIAIK